MKRYRLIKIGENTPASTNGDELPQQHVGWEPTYLPRLYSNIYRGRSHNSYKWWQFTESDMSSIPPEIANAKVNINWNTIEQTLGGKIAPDVRTKYEQVCSGRAFKVAQFLAAFSRLGNLGHIFFITKYIISGGLSEFSFAMWAGIVSVQCISYLYNEWFMSRSNLHDIDADTGEEIFEGESDRVDTSKAKSKLSMLWQRVKNSDSKWKWITIIVLIMLAALLALYTGRVVTEGAYKKQRNTLRRLKESNSKRSSASIPDAKRLMSMSPDQAQKEAQNFMKANNIKNSKQFANAFKDAASQDIQNGKAYVQAAQKNDPKTYEDAQQIAAQNQDEVFLGAATERLKQSFSLKSILLSSALTLISGPSSFIPNMIQFTIPGMLVSGIGFIGSIVYMIASILRIYAGGVVGSAAGVVYKSITYASIGLACCCVIRWLYNYLNNPKKNANKNVINKRDLVRELGINKVPRTKTAEGYIYESVEYLDEGVISYVKTKVTNYIKSTWNCLKKMVSDPSLGNIFRGLLRLLIIGMLLVAGYFGLTSLLGSGAIQNAT